MQDAAAQHNAALTDNEAAQAEIGAPKGNVPKGLLPNLHYGCSPPDALTQHARYTPLPRNAALLQAERVSDADLPRLQQRQPGWFAARALSCTGSACAEQLGFKAPLAAGKLASARLKVHRGTGAPALVDACGGILDARSGVARPPPLPSSTFAACAMAMGTHKESDVMLTYLDYLDALSM